MYCDRSTSHASINSTYSRINRERGESAFPTIGFNGRSGYKQNAAAWWKGFDLLDGVYLVNWCNIRYRFFLSLLLANWYFWCGLQFLFCIEDPPALFPWPTRHGTDERGIPAYASISAPRSIGWHLRSGAPSMALLRPYNTLTLFLLFFSFFSSLLLIHHRCSFLFFFIFSFPNMEDNLSRGCPFYFLLPDHSRFALPFVYYGLIFYFIFLQWRSGGYQNVHVIDWDFFLV